jgi:NAD(P)-dependent dehydrogenase (short-subunit alcohol dehydrogenase family)
MAGTGDRKVAFITGASGGQGRVAVERFVSEGYRVVAADLFQEAVEKVRDEVSAQYEGAEILAVALDQGSEESLRSAARATGEWAGRVDALLLFAGVVQRDTASICAVSSWPAASSHR